MTVKKKILLIDDDEINNYIAQEYIGTTYQDKANLVAYTDAEEAIVFLRTCSRQDFPDLIMCDLKMPAFDGFEFIELYEREFYPLHKNTKMIILSSSIREEDIEKAKSYPVVTDFVPKASIQDSFARIFTHYL